MRPEEQKTDYKNDDNRHRPNGRVWAGLFLLVLGAVYLLREMAFPFFPDWLFTWPMILVAVGIFSGIRHNFRGGTWIVLILVGGFFLVDESDLGINIHRYIVPLCIICVGIMMILRPRWRDEDGDWYRDRFREKYRRRQDQFWNRHDWSNWGPGMQKPSPTPPPTDPASFSSGPAPDSKDSKEPKTEWYQSRFSTEDYIDSVSVFGGVRKVIMSKNFRGGEATSFMGGTELDFTQADINGIVVLELTQVMGGAKLIVPGNWSIKNEVNAVFGGVDDKRDLHVAADPNKVLLLKGTSFFGGLEIRNY